MGGFKIYLGGRIERLDVGQKEREGSVNSSCYCCCCCLHLPWGRLVMPSIEKGNPGGATVEGEGNQNMRQGSRPCDPQVKISHGQLHVKSEAQRRGQGRRLKTTWKTTRSYCIAQGTIFNIL